MVLKHQAKSGLRWIGAVLIAGAATVALSLSGSLTSSAQNGPYATTTTVPVEAQCKPGWGKGDQNHCHTGPPGRTRDMPGDSNGPGNRDRGR